RLTRPARPPLCGPPRAAARGRRHTAARMTLERATLRVPVGDVAPGGQSGFARLSRWRPVTNGRSAWLTMPGAAATTLGMALIAGIAVGPADAKCAPPIGARRTWTP